MNLFRTVVLTLPLIPTHLRSEPLIQPEALNQPAASFISSTYAEVPTLSSKPLRDPFKRLREISGIDASNVYSNLFYVHNDSGDKARVFAISNQDILAEYTMTGIQARDFEDIATAPCGESFCIYVADIGDNGRKRGRYYLHQFKEPTQITNQSVDVTSYEFKYPDGSHNAEAISYNPQDDSFYIVIKQTNNPVAYRLRKPLRNKMVAERVCKLSGIRDAVTGMDINDDGTEMLLRTYAGVYRYNLDADSFCGEKIEFNTYEELGYSEKLGEAIAYTETGFLTISEGLRPNIFRFER